MKHAYVIGLDYGTDSVRALLVDAFTGREIDSEVAFYPRWNKGLYSDPRVARFRQHPKDYLEALRRAVCAVTGRHADLTSDIRALSVDTTASTPCLTDKAGVPLSLHEEYAENPDAMFVLWKARPWERGVRCRCGSDCLRCRARYGQGGRCCSGQRAARCGHCGGCRCGLRSGYSGAPVRCGWQVLPEQQESCVPGAAE